MIDDVSGSAQKNFGDLPLKSRSPEVKMSIKLIIEVLAISAVWRSL